MSAVIAVLAVLAIALAASLSAEVNQGWPNYAAEQPGDVAQSDQTTTDDKPEQKRSHRQPDKGSAKRQQKQKEPACVQDCSDTWPRYELTPWPL
jgi:hypothetical protein